MKTFTAIGLALLVGAGVGYSVSHYMAPMGPNVDSKTLESATTSMTVGNDASSSASSASSPATEVVHGPDDPVVAKVNGKSLYRTDVLDFIKTLPAQMQQANPKDIFPMALDQLVSAKIVDEKAISENFDNDPVVLKRMDLAKTQIRRSVYAEKAIDKQVSDELVKKTYDDIVKNIPKVEEAHARHILVDSEDQAKDIIAKLNSGSKFEDLAKEFSKDKSNSDNGGDLGYFAQTDMVKEFSDAAFALKPNEHTKTPVKTQFGFHVIQLLEKRDRPAPKFEDVKLQVEGQVRRDILEKLVAEWNKAATVEKFDYDGKPIVAETPAASVAAEEKPAEEKPAEEKPVEENKVE